MLFDPPQRITFQHNSRSPIAVEIWEVDLNVAANWRDWYSNLSADERDRAQRYLHSGDRQQFITTRGILRERLGRYLNCPPDRIQFQYGDRGKPSLTPKFQPPDCTYLSTAKKLQFNSSHSSGIALLAFSWDGEIGVDLEAPRAMTDARLLKLARRFFLPSEVEVLESIPKQERSALFFRYWTCKEAYLKATGVGLAGLREAAIVWDRDQGGQPQPIVSRLGRVGVVQSVDLRCGFSGAIAAIGDART